MFTSLTNWINKFKPKPYPLSTNYGIMGLTPLNSNKSIVSDYRTHDLVAVIVHEFGHGFYGARHCTNPKCIMCDYQKHKGKPFVYKLCKEHSFMN